MARSHSGLRYLVLAGSVLSCHGARLTPAAPANGDWASAGYGLIFEIRGDSLTALEVTSVSCLASFRAVAVPAVPGSLAAFKRLDYPLTYLVLADSGSTPTRIRVNGAASDMAVRRLAGRPAACDAPAQNTPQASFDIFARTWDEQYPFFAMRRTDWPAVVAANRVRVTDNTDPRQLFAILRGMIAPLEDAHTFLLAPSLNLGYEALRRSPSSVDGAQQGRALGLVQRYLRRPLVRFCQGQLELGEVNDSLGYLRIRSFDHYHPDSTFESGLTALDAALDSVFGAARSWKGLIIDVRLNDGGYDPYGLAIAARLTATPYVAYAKQAWLRGTAPGAWGPEQTVTVRPSVRPGFRGPVVELIGIQSVSAAETFTQAMLARRPAVIKVGENTQGVFSDVLRRTLPNGWIFGLPNERFTTSGRSYDGVGIRPDVEVTSFTPKALLSGRDAGLERAVQLLMGHQPVSSP